FFNCLKTQRRFKKRQDILLTPKSFSLNGTYDEFHEPCLSDTEILSCIRKEVLAGAYYLLDYRGYADYIEEDNVVFIFAMGSLGTEAIAASKELLKKGVYASVIIVTSPDLLLSNLAHKNNYIHLKQGLALENTAAPIVSVHDGEPGLLDNIGSLLGTYHESLAVRKHSRCGRPREVYQFHGIDKDSIIQACLKALQLNTQNIFQRNTYCPKVPKLN
ncbi:MAG: pyruvate dehydrogenase, partial [Bdellovibrionales bacterium]|nr:pyruvate dehydrogenase [Bdellovibrionales bacterium]